MKSLTKYLASGALALALSAGVATAATVTVIASSVQGIGNTAHIFGAGYGAYIGPGASWSDDPIVIPPPANSNLYQSPFNNTPVVATARYFSVGREDADAEGANSPVDLTFVNVQNAFKILWGSIDSYNTISFSGGSADFSLTGTQLAVMLNLALRPDLANYEHVALLSFTGMDFNKVTFASTRLSLEFALPVPIPAAGFLLIGALGGLALLRRRKTV